MKRNTFFILLSLLVLTGLMLGACQPAAPEPEATEVMEEPTEEMMEETPFEPTSLVAADCDYGGKIKSIEAVDALTVKFTLCKSDPAFESKIAFTPFGIQPAEHIAATGGTGDLLSNPIGT
jgi:ABC-type transport system substrate-binding protein